MNKKVYIWIAIVCIIILIDLLLKTWIIKNSDFGEVIISIKNFLIVARIETHTLSWGLRSQFDYSTIIKAVFFLLFLILFIRLIMRKANHVFTTSVFMIIAGWGGNYLDKLLFSTSASYQQLDYLSFDLISSAFINLGFLVTMAGWLLLIFFVIIKFKDFKRIFESKPSRQIL